MRLLVSLLLCVLLSLNVPVCHSAPTVTRFDELTIEQGLSSNSVNDILQDKEGYLWFATKDGLNRFDGYQIKVFRHDPDDPDSLSDNWVGKLYQDSTGTLWAANKVGLDIYHSDTESFSHFRHIESNPNSLSHDNVMTIHEERSGILWIGTYGGGLNKLDVSTKQFLQFKHASSDPHSLHDNRVIAVLKDLQGTLWIGSETGLSTFDELTGQFTVIREPGANNRFRVNDIHQDSSAMIWLATSKGLKKYNTQTETLSPWRVDIDNKSALNHDEVFSIDKDTNGLLWIGTSAGLFSLAPDTLQTEQLQHNPTDPHSLRHNYVRTVHKDNSGVLWVGTHGGGIGKYDTKQARFSHFNHQSTNPDSLSHNIVQAFDVGTNGIVWVGTESGLNRYDSRQGKFERFTHHSNDPHSLSDNSIFAIFEDNLNKIWVGTHLGGLNKYDSQTVRFEHFRHRQNDPTSLSHDQVWSISQDSKGTLWVSTIDGLNRFDSKSGFFKRFKHHPDDPSSISHNHTTRVFEDSAGSLWVGTFGGGVNKYDAKTQSFERYRHQPGNQHSLSHNSVTTIMQDSKGRLWVGTYGGGLNRYDPNSDGFIHFRESDGLANDGVYGILEDNSGYLWISTNYGISKFDPDTETFRNYTASDGLQSNEFNYGAYSQGKRSQGANEQLYFGGINGFNRFNPKDINDNTQPPTVVLTDFLLFNQQISITNPRNTENFTLSKSVNNLEHLQLNYRQNLMTFEFSALDFTNPKKNQYAYRLIGWDRDWIYTASNNRRATYTNIPSGDYTLMVKASNSDGYWSEHAKSLKITINPAPWKTWQAYLLYLIIVVGGLYWLFRYRTQAIVDRANELEQGVRQRTETINQLMAQKDRMFANISHEFKTPLTLILNPLEAMIHHTSATPFVPQMSMMKRNAQRLLRMIEQLLELSKLESEQSEKRYQYSLTQVLEVLLASFEPLFQSKHLSLTKPEFDDVIVSLKADALEMILSNLISNAIKYTPEHGNITITVSRENQNVVIQVQDSGIGIDEANQQQVFNRFTRASEQHGENIPGAGIGLALVKELVHSHKGTVTLASELGKGSTFTVTLPISEQQQMPVEQVRDLSHTSQIEIDSMTCEQISQPPNNDIRLLDTRALDTRALDNSAATVLMIDDNADMLALLVETLSGKFQCLTAQNGEQGLAVALEHLPDLVISDVMMPGISGHEVVKRLKQTEMTCHIPVILLTAKGGIQSRIDAWSHNADEYLDKPFNAIELNTRIDNLLSIRKLLRQRFARELAQTQPSSQTSAIETLNEVTPEITQLNGITNVNQVFFDKITGVLEKHYSDETLDVSLLAEHLAMSARQLSRKMKALLDMTPTETIRNFRLKKAAERLAKGVSPSDVAHQVGFSSHSYFSQCFKVQYNCMPSAYKTTTTA